MKVALISLGCPKNRVDSELILGSLGERGFSFTSEISKADLVILNTCSFIREAREESYLWLEKLSFQKRKRQRLIVCGCLPQLEKRKLFSRYPQIDAILGTGDFPKIPAIVERINKGKRIFVVSEPSFIYNSSFPRFLSTPPSYAWLKISEGCSNFCSYCLIPRLRGKYRSRPLKDILKEAKILAELGIKEIILIGQDTTFYGKDKRNFLLSSLLENLEKVEKIRWIRLLYTHPAHFPLSLIKIMKNSDKVVPYVDLPLQHTHPEILKKMNRPDFKLAEKVFFLLREKIPEITLRTTFMVGFPGEEEKHFKKLLRDVKRFEFDWVGVFSYSPEKGTEAEREPLQVEEKVKRERRREIMELQREITLRKNQKRVGRIFPLLVDAPGEGHTPFQAPEIDGKSILKDGFSPGRLLRVRVKEVREVYDLLVEPRGEI